MIPWRQISKNFALPSKLHEPDYVLFLKCTVSPFHLPEIQQLCVLKYALTTAHPMGKEADSLPPHLTMAKGEHHGWLQDCSTTPLASMFFSMTPPHYHPHPHVHCTGLWHDCCSTCGPPVVGAVAAEMTRGEQLDLSPSCRNVTLAAQRDGAAVMTPPTHYILVLHMPSHYITPCDSTSQVQLNEIPYFKNGYVEVYITFEFSPVVCTRHSYEEYLLLWFTKI